MKLARLDEFDLHVPSPEPQGRLEVVKTTEALEAVAKDWRRLSLRAGRSWQLFQSLLWNQCWWDHFGHAKGVELHILAGYEGDELVFLWPLIKRHIGPFKIIEPTGGLLSCYTDALLAQDGEAFIWFNRAFEYLQGEAKLDWIRLEGVHEAGHLGSYLRSQGHQADVGMTAPFLDCGAYMNFDDYFRSRSKRTRKNQKRSWRHMEEAGPVERLFALEPTEGEAIVRRAISFKRDWLRENGLNGKTIASPAGEEFLVDLVGRTLSPASETREVELRPGIVKQNGEPIAIGIGFGYHGRHYEYMGAFDVSVNAPGIGRCQMEASIEQAFTDNMQVLDFLTPGTEFKAKWSDKEPAAGRYLLPLSSVGHLYKDGYVKRLRPQLKSMLNATPTPVRRLLFS